MATINDIDHIVWAVRNLEEGMNLFLQKTGVQPTYGGLHTTQGTKNALVKIGPRSYFEILAPDLDSKIQANRWMGIDEIAHPKITRWALSTDDIYAKRDTLKSYDPALAIISEGSRLLQSGGTLQWRMTLPTATPMVQLAPFYIDWSDSVYHPCDQLDQHCTITSIQFYHPAPASIRTLYQDLTLKKHDIIKGQVNICLTLATPKGLVTFE